MLDKASRLAPQDPWTTSVRVFLNDGLHSPSFTGSCCEFRVQLKASPKIAKAKLQPPTGVPSYDGHLHYPEYNLLVDSNFSAIDLLALAEQPGLAPGVLHGVVQPEDAHLFQQEGVIASGSGMLELDSFETTLEFSNPMNEGATEKVLVKVIILDRTNVDCLKGSHPTAAAIEKAGTCTGPSTGNSPLQATIILGAPANKNGSASYFLLLARLYTLEINVDQKVANALYDHLQSKLKRGGFEGRRFGGSGGRVEVNENLLKFIHHPGNFPRKGKGIKFVCNENTWNCLYMSPYQSALTVVKVHYSQPQKGGSMSLREADTAAFPCLQTFAKSKPFGALLLQALNHQVLKIYKTGRLCYPTPLLKELEHLSLAKEQSKGSKSRLLDALVLLNKHTLVAYPVGYHVDVFADQEPALENRICFVHSKKSQDKNGPAQGRGGAGGGLFCWALLDWPEKRARFGNRKRVQ
jgi:hypothetical protein